MINTVKKKPLEILNFVGTVNAAGQHSVYELTGSFSVYQDETSVQHSGNPGYVIGLPLVSGTRTAEYPPHEVLDEIF